MLVVTSGNELLEVPILTPGRRKNLGQVPTLELVALVVVKGIANASGKNVFLSPKVSVLENF